MEDFTENTRNFYVVRHRLAGLEKRGSHFEYWVGDFVLKISTDPIQEHTSPENDRITFHSKLEVNLYELLRDSSGRKVETYVALDRDPRFCEYQPIKYGTPYQRSDGREMPIDKLCELVIYLH